jgi:hypothetical protein
MYRIVQIVELGEVQPYSSCDVFQQLLILIASVHRYRDVDRLFYNCGSILALLL